MDVFHKFMVLFSSFVLLLCLSRNFLASFESIKYRYALNLETPSRDTLTVGKLEAHNDKGRVEFKFSWGLELALDVELEFLITRNSNPTLLFAVIL